MEMAAELSDSIADGDNLLTIETGALGEAVARVVATEFEEALTTTEGLLERITDYQASAHRQEQFSAL